MIDQWECRADGYINRMMGVFPDYCGAWEVWTKLTGKWRPIEPRVAAKESEAAKKLASNWISTWMDTKPKTKKYARE